MIEQNDREKLRTQKLGLVEELESFAKGLKQITLLKEKGEELEDWCFDARKGLKTEHEVVKAINLYRTKLSNVLDDIKFQFEYLSGEELAKVIKAMFPPKPPKPKPWQKQTKPIKAKVEERPEDKTPAFWEI